MNRRQYLLIKLAEEAAEVAQIALKTAQFGLFETSPYHTENNARRCHGELTDMMAIVSMLNEEFNFGYTNDSVSQNIKKDKVNKYYQYSIDLGEVDDNRN